MRQLPSNGDAVAGTVKPRMAKAVERTKARMRLRIMELLMVASLSSLRVVSGDVISSGGGA
jgi:hypothetical protein